MDKEKHVDEAWKDSVESEKRAPDKEQPGSPLETGHNGASPAGEAGEIQINFTNYVTSLTLQALIFLGEIAHPESENRVEINLPQAKFVIDTLIIIRDKTKGNLTPEEDNLLNASIYELQLKFVEQSKRQGSS